MSLTPPEMQGSVVTRAAHECNGSDKQLEQHPWQCGYPQATTDATFARQYVAFARTEAISPLELPARSAPVPILGTKLEKGLPLKGEFISPRAETFLLNLNRNNSQVEACAWSRAILLSPLGEDQ